GYHLGTAAWRHRRLRMPLFSPSPAGTCRTIRCDGCGRASPTVARHRAEFSMSRMGTPGYFPAWLVNIEDGPASSSGRQGALPHKTFKRNDVERRNAERPDHSQIP